MDPQHSHSQPQNRQPARHPAAGVTRYRNHVIEHLKHLHQGEIPAGTSYELGSDKTLRTAVAAFLIEQIWPHIEAWIVENRDSFGLAGITRTDGDPPTYQLHSKAPEELFNELQIQSIPHFASKLASAMGASSQPIIDAWLNDAFESSGTVGSVARLYRDMLIASRRYADKRYHASRLGYTGPGYLLATGVKNGFSVFWQIFAAGERRLLAMAPDGASPEEHLSLARFSMNLARSISWLNVDSMQPVLDSLQIPVLTSSESLGRQVMAHKKTIPFWFEPSRFEVRRHNGMATITIPDSVKKHWGPRAIQTFSRTFGETTLDTEVTTGCPVNFARTDDGNGGKCRIVSRIEHWQELVVREVFLPRLKDLRADPTSTG